MVYAEDGTTLLATYYEVTDAEIESGRLKAWLLEKYPNCKPKARREPLVGGSK